MPWLTAEANIAFGAGRIGLAERQRRSSALLDLVGLAGLGHRLPKDLSGGRPWCSVTGRRLRPW